MSDHIAALLHLKAKLHKWKNIALIVSMFSFLLCFRFLFGGNIDRSVVTDSIVKIEISGVIFEDDNRSEILKELSENNSVKAVIVNINSPGGGIVGSEILFNELRKIATIKPIVVVMKSVAASGGYMAAIASDHIIAHNGTLTGSIGVLMESPNVAELANKIGVEFNTYKSSPLKGSPSPFEKPSLVVDKVIQDSINDSFGFFADLVKERRAGKLNPKAQNIIFDGRVFTGRQALAVGLVDEIGGEEQALKYLSQKNIDIKRTPVVKVDLIKDDEGFLRKFLGSFSWLSFIEGRENYEQKMMSIMR